MSLLKTAMGTDLSAARHLVFLLLVLTSLPRQSQGCFPLEEIFQGQRNWLQSISLHARNIITVGSESENIMTIETEGLPKKHETQILCLMAYGNHRYLVRVDEEDKEYTFQCLQFTVLEARVIRQGRTRPELVRKRVDCIDDPYTEDEAVLVANEDLMPIACPMTGGYQLIMHQSAAITNNCLDSVDQYNPRIQFQCDNQLSSNVIADFGKACTPVILGDEMLSRQFVPLECIAMWDEDDFKSLLLRMKHYPRVFWCLHYKTGKHSKAGVTDPDWEQYWSIFLTMDGRCPSQAFGGKDMPRNSSTFGHLISYLPSSDLKCREKAYLENCKLKGGSNCLESPECPSMCGRCKPMLTTLNCSFPANTLGRWKAVNSGRKLDLTVEKNKFIGSSFGEFMCTGPAESLLPENTYPVVQTGIHPHCMPFYSCARLFSPVQGLLTFRIRASVRDDLTGQVLSCQETEKRIGHVRPRPPEEVITLVSKDKLQRVSCDILFTATFPTILDSCRIAVNQCRDDCKVLNAGYDIPTCGNDTVLKIENQHECLALLEFEDNLRGILTKSLNMGRYLCWIFSPNLLFVASPDKCNQEGVEMIYQDMNARTRYDPINAISLPMADSKDSNSAYTVQLFQGVLFLSTLMQAVIMAL